MLRKLRARNRHLGRMFQNMKSPGAEIVLTAAQFQSELAKEVYRSDRRDFGREFGLIRLRPKAANLTINYIEVFESPDFGQVLGRLRITDSIGWHKESLAILLPESSHDGTLVLANEIVKILSNSRWQFVAEVSTYPVDDELISVADEIQELSKNWPAREPDDESGDDHFLDGRRDSDHQGVGKPHAEAFASFNPSHGDTGRESWGASATAVAERPQALHGLEKSRTLQLDAAVVEKRHRFLQSVKTPFGKRAIDIAGASLGLVVLSPVLVFAVMAIKATSGGPVFFRQMREGKDGRKFCILKFRTMVADAEKLQGRLRDKNEQDGPAFKLANDPRVTSVGRYLRRSCVDELPQLLNILKGDMSLVGPRPLPVEESLACTAWQRSRLTVLPGLTCTWQAYGGRDVKFAQWMQMDLDYIERRSFWFDLKLIFDTACMAFMHRGSV